MGFNEIVHGVLVALTFLLFFLQNVTCFNHHEILTTKTIHTIGQHYGDFINELAKEYFPIELPLVIVLSSTESCARSLLPSKGSHAEFGDKYLLKYSDDMMQRIHEDMNHNIIILGCQDIGTAYMYQDLTRLVLGHANIVFVVPDATFQNQLIWTVRSMYEMVIAISNIHKAVILFTNSSELEKYEFDPVQIFNIVTFVFKGRDTTVITPRQNTSLVDRPPMDVTIWFPEDQEDPCFLEIDTGITVDTWISKKKGFLNHRCLFPPKDFKNKEKCKVNVGVIETTPFISTGDRKENKSGRIN